MTIMAMIQTSSVVKGVILPWDSDVVRRFDQPWETLINTSHAIKSLQNLFFDVPLNSDAGHA